jgi:hypothetical protein
MGDNLACGCDGFAATPLPAPDPLDEVVGRVRNRVAPDGRAWLPCDLDGNPIPEVRYDLAKLLAAYQSAREQLAHQKQVAEDAEVRAMVATASLAARTGGTE